MENPQLTELKARIQVCVKCPLHRSRTQAVPGEGNPAARIVLAGQGPGENEDRLGRPFVGAAGALLEKLLTRVGLRREDLWISNVTRCLPPDGRRPHAAEIKTCAPYLLEEIDLIRPLVVCPLGNMALSLLLRKPAQIQSLRGKAIPRQNYFLFPMLHPAAALRKPAVEEDFRRLKRFLDSDPVLQPPPGQESLF
jgi:DNA polymerase